MTSPHSPFGLLFAQLSQAMSAQSAATGVRAPVTHELGSQADAMHTQADRLVWIPADVECTERPFQLPDSVSPIDQGVSFEVSIYASSFWRALDLHAWLVGWIDLINGPIQGCSPSMDSEPATITGSTNLNDLVYPFAGLDGLSLSFTSPFVRALTFGAAEITRPIGIAVAVTALARAARVPLLASIDRADGNAYLVLAAPQDPLSPLAFALTLDPAADDSACALLGFEAGVNASAVSTPPSVPYRPGYAVGRSQPGPRGGNPASAGWGLIVPVTLRRPIDSLRWIAATIQETSFTVGASSTTTSDDADIAVENPTGA